MISRKSSAGILICGGVILAIAIGWFFFAEAPTAVVLTGAAVVILAGILIIWRERRLGLERNRQRKAMTPQG